MKTTLTALFLCTLILMGCGIADDASNTLKEVKKSNEGIEKTNKAIHLQTLSVALSALTAKENSENPLVPSGMIPNAKVFADEATTEELIQEFHLLLTDAIKGANADDESIGVRPHSRLVRYFAASAIAALTSTEKFNKIVEEQVTNEGRFYDTAKAFILCRYTFTKAYLFNPLFDVTFVKSGKDGETAVSQPRTVTLDLLKEAIEAFTTMKSIYAMPFAKNLAITIPEVLPEVTEEVDPLDPKKTVKITNYKPYSASIKRQDFEKVESNVKTLGERALEKFDDKKNSKMQTDEIQGLMKVFR